MPAEKYPRDKPINVTYRGGGSIRKPVRANGIIARPDDNRNVASQRRKSESGKYYGVFSVGRLAKKRETIFSPDIHGRRRVSVKLSVELSIRFYFESTGHTGARCPIFQSFKVTTSQDN